MADDKTFGAVLRDLTNSVFDGNVRKAAGKAGISRTTWYDLMDNLSTPTKDTVDKMAEAFDGDAPVLYYAASMSVPPRFHPTLRALAEKTGESPEELYERAVAELAQRVQ